MSTKMTPKDSKKTANQEQAPVIKFDELESEQLANISGGAIHVHAKK